MLISGTPDLQRPAVAESCGTPWPLNAPCGFFFSARYALFHALRSLGLGPNDTILVPAYCCGTEIDPILAAGVKIEWCDVEESLDVAHRMREVLQTRDCRAILVTHYFGVDRLSDELLSYCRARGIVIVEDCTHAFLSSDSRGRGLGTRGDAAVFSLRKSLGIPDGGVLVLNREPVGLRVPEEALRGPNRLAIWYRALELVRDSSTWNSGGNRTRRAMARSLAGAALQTRLALRVMRKITGLGGRCLLNPNSYEFVPEAVWWGMSAFSRRRLGVKYPDVLQRRRGNFLRLQQLLTEIPEVKQILPILPAGACPLLFPILLSDRATVCTLLAQNGIDSHPWWAFFHPAVPWSRFPAARQLKTQVLGLPVHQGLGRIHMERVAHGLREALALARRAA